MNFIITLIAFIIILGVTVLIHEAGHFYFAKRAGIYVYEFSIGMGPKLFSWKRKNDETEYFIRWIPIGGYVQMAGEEIEPDENIPKEKRMQSKTWFQKFMTVIAGVMMNFILAIVLLFIIALVAGSTSLTPTIGEVEKNNPASETGLQAGDKVLSINGKDIITSDQFVLEIQVNGKNTAKIEVEHKNGKQEMLSVKPEKQKDADGNTVYQYGMALDGTRDYGVFAALKYAFGKTFSLLHQMVLIIFYLCTGALSLNNLAGPVGIFNLVGESAAAGFINLVYLVAYLSINVGFINLLPLPAFDGGRILFMIIEKIKGSPVSPRIENWIHSVGFVLLMLLMIFVTYNDIMRHFS